MKFDSRYLSYLSETPITASALAETLGLDCADVLPVLNALRDEGLVARVSLDESGLCGWRLP
jgi:DNA-binding IclR family transcriptional regulator